MKSSALIMVADDSQDDCHLLKRAFDAAGIPNRVEFVRDGQALLDHLGKEGAEIPALVLLDLNMPRMGGKEALAQMRADARLKSIPVLVLSTSSAGGDVQESYRLGANAVSVKPFEYSKFVEFASMVRSYWLELAELPGPDRA